MEADFNTALTLFLHANRNILTDFQKRVIQLVLDADHGPDEAAEALQIISNQITHLRYIGWQPKSKSGDMVNRPSHYDVFVMEPTFFIVETGGFNWCLENFFKYICRFPFKNGIEDLRKAMRNLEMFLKYADGDPEWSR
ncbi:DUF3310 domain-containing protein [Brucella tritici]|uniref:DUF3310 domain-containing protein n=1 Tax=Brucella tritici TaxID=94626 RepID=A0A833CIG5_9HYPH|nr:DUF3310 domain-containing protein [Brucella tritici]KAB2662750.1 DUF3310 domain-containing protein [Brucella tritici]